MCVTCGYVWFFPTLKRELMALLKTKQLEKKNIRRFFLPFLNPLRFCNVNTLRGEPKWGQDPLWDVCH